MDTADVTGLCLGLIRDNKVVYTKGYGYKNTALHRLNDTATCFYAASLAKSLFAYLVMQLVDERKIDLDKPLYTYLPKPLPSYENYKDLAGDDRWKLITARHCLSHTTGFPNWREMNPHRNNKLEILFQPGAHYAYSGEGINLLQVVVETVTGRKLEDLAREKIFRPFGMRRTSFIWQQAFESDYALGHDRNGDTLTKFKRDQAYAAGSMETTVADYTRFMAAVLNGKGLSPASRRQMLTPQIPVDGWREASIFDSAAAVETRHMHVSYGLGWGIFSSAYGKAFFKEGHIDGWVHYVIALPESRSALIIMCNNTNGESIFKELVEKIMGVAIPWRWEGYQPYRANVKLPDAVLRSITGEYDGRLKAIITLENGRLKVESPTVHLSKTNLYAVNDHHFYLKIMDTEIDFVKGPDGKIEKAVLDDEGEHYELKKVR
jgi:CubicO group peptidase (beta-lactamase class C family)